MARRAQVSEIELAPEIDRLDAFPHPRHTAHLFGHHHARQELGTAIASGRMHHAWILTGPDGIGKATLAYKAASYALADPAERNEALSLAPQTIAARQVGQLCHPGLLVIRRTYDMRNKRFASAISVDEVRRLRGFLSHRSEPGHWRVVIVDRADELNLNAANALLKSLEEPPSRTVFFLIAIEPGRLLPTIRSRCRLLPLQRLAEPDLLAAAEQACASAQVPEVAGELETLVPIADGSVRRLLTMAAGDGRAIAASINQLFNSLPSLDWQKCHELAERWAPSQARVGFELFYALLQEKIARLIKARAGGEVGAEDREMALQLIGEGELVSWAELWETLHREKTRADALNLDRAALIVDAFTRISRTAAHQL